VRLKRAHGSQKQHAPNRLWRNTRDSCTRARTTAERQARRDAACFLSLGALAAHYRGRRGRSLRSVAGRKPRSRYYVRAMSRAAGRAFGAARVVTATTEFVDDVSIASDEDGRVTLAWTEDHYGDDPSVGNNGITSAVRVATGQAGSPFSAPREVATRRSRFFSTPALAAANGRVALAWGLEADRKALGVQAVVGPARALGAPQTVVAKQPTPGYYRSPPAISVALDPSGSATVLYEEPVEGANGPVMTRLMAANGS
jgi:hypothetical protein